ncbi:MAG: DUF3471 domain-containing protein [Acidobacteria bacterium]|jgi:hypothetical protein|nr:DUF3471 domain-containing protein [Acidobacteriota bacterium]
MMKKTILVVIAISILGLQITMDIGQAAANTPNTVVHKFDSTDLQKNWTVKLKEPEIIQYKGKNALHLKQAKGPGLAILKDVEFVNGIIELDIAGIPKFAGIVFRLVDDYTYEGIYFRPPNDGTAPKRNDAVQYISHPRYTWNYLRENFPGKYEATADVPYEEWFHVRIEVIDEQAKVFINNSPTPCLVVNDLKRGISKGAVGVWCGNESGGTFANFSVTPKKSDKPLSTPSDMQQRKEIKLDPKIFQTYVGKYQMKDNPEFFVNFMIENGLFYTQATGQNKFQIFAEAENKFFLKVVDAQITFIKDKEGKIIDIFVTQGGNEMHLKKVN